MNIINFINKYIVYIAIILLLIGTGMMIDISLREKTLDNEREIKKTKSDATILLIVGGVLILIFIIVVHGKSIREWSSNTIGYRFGNKKYNYIESEESWRPKAPRGSDRIDQSPLSRGPSLRGGRYDSKLNNPLL
jgi:hypothetical protein